MKSKSQKITKAVIAVAGYGTRFLPATKCQPKEMLPIVDKPIVQYLVEEAVASGITDIIIVCRAGQHILEDHFDSNLELEYMLKLNGKKQALEKVQQISRLANIAYVRQSKDYPYGNGTPLLIAKNFIDDDEFFVYMFGDDLVKADVPCVKQMLASWNRDKKSIFLAAQEVDKRETSRYGILKLKQGSSDEVEGGVEKPKPEQAPSNLAQFGRFILNYDIIKLLEQRKLGQGNELWLADAVFRYAREGGRVRAVRIKGEWHTTGDPLRYMKAQVRYALDRPDIGQEFRQYLRNLDL